MFKDAGWQDFGWWVSISLLVYYGYVVLRYYPEWLRRLAFFSTARPAETVATPVPDSVKQIADSLRRTIREAGGKPFARELLLAELRSLLEGLNSNDRQRYTEQLRQIIITEAADYCSIRIEAEELV